MKRALCIAFLFFLIVRIPTFAQYNKGILVETILKTDTTSIGQKLAFPRSDKDEVTICKVTIPPGDSTGWHKHERCVFAYVVQGTLRVKLEDKTLRKFTKGSCFAEVIQTMHNGYNAGKKDVVLIAFYLGEKGQPLSEKK